MEVEEMINKVREEQGRPFDMRQLTTSCVANVTLNMLFGRRFDHSDPAYQQLISDVNELTSNFSFAVQLFPILRFLPYFRKIRAKGIITAGNVFGYINNNIATCTEVCICCCAMQDYKYMYGRLHFYFITLELFRVA